MPSLRKSTSESLEKKRVLELTLFRKDKPIGQTFGSGFSWPEAIDAAADVYNGVSQSRSVRLLLFDQADD